jgi:hypothetical protein
MIERPRRWIVLVVGLVAVLVHLPALAAPYMFDDHVQAAMFDGSYPVARRPLDLYDFVRDGDRQTLLDKGILPWWSHPKLTVRFLRPLSSVLLWADYRLFGRSALEAHLHSLLWWALASVAVYALIRRTLGRRVALLGGAAYAFSPSHALPLVWVANREALVCTALGALGLSAHLRWRERGRTRDAVVAAALFSLALLGGEYALCFGGYVLALELVRRRGTLTSRGEGTWPFVVPAVAYLVVRWRLGCWAAGTGFYRDPFVSPGPFLAGAPRRLAVLLLDGWLTLDADSFWATASPWALAALVLIALAMSILPMRRAMAALDPTRREYAAWLLWGSLLAVAPVLAVHPSVRLMSIPSIGVCAIIGVLLEHAWFPAQPAPRRGVSELTALVAVAFGFAHLVRAPVYQWLLIRGTSVVEELFDARIAELRKLGSDLGSKNVVVVRADSWPTTYFAPFMLDERRGVPPARWTVLTLGSVRALMLRTGPRTIELVASTPNPLFPMGPNDLLRNEEAPAHIGDVTEVSGLRTTIVELAAGGGPRRVRFEFDRDLDDPSFWFVAEGDLGFKEVVPPRVGMGWPLGR